MGGGQVQEIIQFALPWPEPTDILNRIRRKHPNVEVRYFNLTSKNHDPDIPVAQAAFPVGIYG